MHTARTRCGIAKMARSQELYFYQTEFLNDNFVHYKCVNNDMGKIYQDFLQYLSEVKMLRKEYLSNDGE